MSQILAVVLRTKLSDLVGIMLCSKCESSTEYRRGTWWQVQIIGRAEENAEDGIFFMHVLCEIFQQCDILAFISYGG